MDNQTKDHLRGTAERQSHIAEQVEHLFCNLENLENAIERMGGRLTPVLRESEPCEVGKCSTEPPELVMLARQIRDAALRVSYATASIEDMERRLEL